MRKRHGPGGSHCWSERVAIAWGRLLWWDYLLWGTHKCTSPTINIFIRAAGFIIIRDYVFASSIRFSCTSFFFKIIILIFFISCLFLIIKIIVLFRIIGIFQIICLSIYLVFYSNHSKQYFLYCCFNDCFINQSIDQPKFIIHPRKAPYLQYIPLSPDFMRQQHFINLSGAPLPGVRAKGPSKRRSSWRLQRIKCGGGDRGARKGKRGWNPQNNAIREANWIFCDGGWRWMPHYRHFCVRVRR